MKTLRKYEFLSDIGSEDGRSLHAEKQTVIVQR
jgi:hypothetical protein